MILHSTEFPFIDNEFIKLFCGRIQRLDIDVFSGLERLSEIDYIYFFNVQHISLTCITVGEDLFNMQILS